MAYNSYTSACTATLTVHWTQNGRSNIFLGDIDPNDGNNSKIRITKFGIGDSDINYKIDNTPSGGTVPRITGDDIDCLQSVAKCIRFTPNVPKSREGISIIDNFEECYSLCDPRCVFTFENCLSIKGTSLDEYVKYESSTHGENYNILNNTSKEYTFNMWVKGGGVIFSQNEYSSEDLVESPLKGWIIEYEEVAPSAFITLKVKNGTNQITYTATFDTFLMGEFNNIMITRVNDVMSFYLNGVKSTQVTENIIGGSKANTFDFDVEEDLFVGYNRDSNVEYHFDGFVREFWIGDTAYSDDEVLSNFNEKDGACPIYTDGLYVYSRFNSKSGAVALDDSDYNNNGVLTNYSTQRTTIPDGDTFAPAWSCQDTCEYGEYFQGFKGNYIQTNTPPETFTKFNSINKSIRESDIQFLAELSTLTGDTQEAVSAETAPFLTQNIITDTTDDGFSIEFWMKVDEIHPNIAVPIISTFPDEPVGVNRATGNTYIASYFGFDVTGGNLLHFGQDSGETKDAFIAFKEIYESRSENIFGNIILFAHRGYRPGTIGVEDTYELSFWAPNQYTGDTYTYQSKINNLLNNPITGDVYKQVGEEFLYDYIRYTNIFDDIGKLNGNYDIRNGPPSFNSFDSPSITFNYPYRFPQYKFNVGEWYHIVLRVNQKKSFNASYPFRLLGGYFGAILPDDNGDYLNTGLWTGTTTSVIDGSSFQYGDDEWGTRLFVNGEQEYYEGVISDASDLDYAWYNSTTNQNPSLGTNFNPTTKGGHINAPLIYNAQGFMEQYNYMNKESIDFSDRSVSILSPFSAYTGPGLIKVEISGGTTSVDTSTQYYGDTGLTVTEYLLNAYVHTEFFSNVENPTSYFNARYLDIYNGFTATTKINIDELRIYNRPITNTEVNEHYNCIYNDESDLVLYYPFNETSGTTVPDQSTLSYDGSVINSSADTTTNWKSIR